MLNHATLYDKMYGCWLGKNIGGTLGTPMEGQRNPQPLPLEFPKANEPNDDLDLQLVWLDMIRRKGLQVTPDDFAECWLNHIAYPYDEYGVARANLKRGVQAPWTGVMNNFFKDCMGSPIRSEIWGCLCAGRPAQAAYYAQCDALLDHYDEGVYGEVLFAVMESAAFEESDLCKLTRIGLEYLPSSSLVYEAVQYTLAAYESGTPLAELREELVKRYGNLHTNFTYCVTNIAFTIAGVLYCEGDFLKAMVWSINLGFDTDCTGATAGSIIGIVKGYQAIQAEYNGIEFDTRILASANGVKDITVPPTIAAMTEELIALREKMETLPHVPELAKHQALPRPEVKQYHFHRRFQIANTLPDAAAALAALQSKRDFVRLDSPVDTLELANFFCAGNPVYLATELEFKAAGRFRIHPHSDSPVRCWIDGQFVGEFSGDQFAPSPHRTAATAAQEIAAGTKMQVLCEVKAPAAESLFALLISNPDNDHVVTTEFNFCY